MQILTMILTNEELLLNLNHEICSSTLLQSYQGIYSARSLLHITTRKLSIWLLSMVRDYFWKYVYKQRIVSQFFYNCFKSNFILLTLKMHCNIHEVQTNTVWFHWYKKYLNSQIHRTRKYTGRFQGSEGGWEGGRMRS